MKVEKLWITIRTKKEYTRFGIPEIVGIFYNPYNKPVKYWINFWILPEYRHQVYGYKHS